MKIVFLKSILFFLFFFSCSKKEIVKLPITTSSEKAFEYYKKAMSSLEVGDDFEKRIFLDSALSLDSEFIMALELYDSPDPILTKKNQEIKNKFIEKANKIKLLLSKKNSFLYLSKTIKMDIIIKIKETGKADDKKNIPK